MWLLSAWHCCTVDVRLHWMTTLHQFHLTMEQLLVQGEVRKPKMIWWTQSLTVFDFCHGTLMVWITTALTYVRRLCVRKLRSELMHCILCICLLCSTLIIFFFIVGTIMMELSQNKCISLYGISVYFWILIDAEQLTAYCLLIEKISCRSILLWKQCASLILGS